MAESTVREHNARTSNVAIRAPLVVLLAFAGCLYLFFAAGVIFWAVMSWRSTYGVNSVDALGDFGRFWYVGRYFIVERLTDIGVHTAPGSWMTATIHWNPLAANGDRYREWLYPPTMTLLAMLAATAPLPISFCLWSILTVLGAGWIMRLAGLDLKSIALGLCGTCAVQNYVMGQNGVLTGGLLVAALLWCERRPRTSGVAAGLLAIKPQIGLIMAAVFLPRRHWATLMPALGAVAGLVVLSGVIEGWSSWQSFIQVERPAAIAVLQAPFQSKFLVAGATVFFMARSFHAGLGLAYLLQAMCGAAAMTLTWMVWGRPGGPRIQRMALTTCLAALVSPYGYFYDLIGYSIGMAAMYFRVPDGRKPIYAFLWLAPGYCAIIGELTSYIVTPVVLALGALMVWRDMKGSG
jgi:hypothetical protein